MLHVTQETSSPTEPSLASPKGKTLEPVFSLNGHSEFQYLEGNMALYGC